MHKSKHCRRGWRDSLIPITLFSLFTALISLALSAPAFADPPGRIGRVAWLSEANGLVLESQGRDESFRPTVNQPLTSGDVLSTEGNARAEIQIGSTTLRLDADTSIELTRIDDERVSVSLQGGSSIVKIVSEETAREFELNTPDGHVTTRNAGTFRVDVDDDKSSATAYFGTLHFAANDTGFDIQTGERADVWFAGQTRHRLLSPASDEFMHWSAARDEHPATAIASRYVSPEMTGADDLDAYGDWAETPDYGPIWTPRSVAADWTPYRSGHWVWVAPWGWNWVGQEPWGFAPFHYGRWVQFRDRWSWVPGTRIAHPVYAPALVSWRTTPGVSVTFSSGRAPTSGWFPLAPREVYVPIHRSSPDYVRHINRPYVTRIENPDLIVDNRHEPDRNLHYRRHDVPDTTPPRPFIRDTPTDHSWLMPLRTREYRRGDDGQSERRRETVENQREPRAAELPMPGNIEQHRMEPRPDTPRRAQPEERLEQRADTSHRAPPDDDLRKHHQRADGDNTR